MIDFTKIETKVTYSDVLKARQSRANRRNIANSGLNSDSYNTKSVKKNKKNNKNKINPLITAGLIIAGGFALFKGRGKIKQVFTTLKNTKLGQNTVKLFKYIHDLGANALSLFKLKFPKVTNKIGGAVNKIKNIFSKKT